MGIGAELALDGEEHAGLAVDRRRADGRRRALFNDGDIAERDRLRCGFVHHDLRQLLKRQRLSFSGHDDALIGVFDETGAAYRACLARRRRHLLQRKPVAHQLLRLHAHLPLLQIAAEHIHIRHARNAEQMRPHDAIDEGAQFHQRTFLRRQADAEHRAGGRG